MELKINCCRLLVFTGMKKIVSDCVSHHDEKINLINCTSLLHAILPVSDSCLNFIKILLRSIFRNKFPST